MLHRDEKRPMILLFIVALACLIVGDREMEVLVTGASCLQLFVQNNWMGPPTTTPPASYLPDPLSDCKVCYHAAGTVVDLMV